MPLSQVASAGGCDRGEERIEPQIRKERKDRKALARISHTLPAAAADAPAGTAFLAAVAPATCLKDANAHAGPCGASDLSVRPPCGRCARSLPAPWSKRRADGRLRALVTKACEKCGLERPAPPSELLHDAACALPLPGGPRPRPSFWRSRWRLCSANVKDNRAGMDRAQSQASRQVADRHVIPFDPAETDVGVLRMTVWEGVR